MLNLAQKRALMLCILPCAIALSRGPAKAEEAAGAPARSTIEHGRAALEDGLYSVAREKFSALLDNAKSPAEKAEYALRLSEALYGLGEYKAMENVLREHVPLKGALADGFDAGLAYAQFGLQQWDSALALARQFEKDHPESPRIPDMIRLQALASTQLGGTDDALSCFARFAANYPDSPDAPRNLLEWSMYLSDSGRDDEAAALLEKLLALNLENRIGHECRIRLGSIYARAGRMTEAEQALKPLLNGSQVPDGMRGMAVSVLSDAARTQADYLSALALLDAGLAKVTDPATKADLNLKKGRILLKMGRTDDGIALIRGFVSSSLSPEAAKTVQLELAEMLLSAGNGEKALAEYQNYLGTFSDQAGAATANEGRGWALIMLGRHEEAQATFEKAAELAALESDRARCLFKIGDSRFAAGRFKSAIEAYERVIALYPETPIADHATFQVAAAMALLDDKSGAESFFWSLVDKDSHGALAGEALLRIAALKENQGNWNDALSIYSMVFDDYGGRAGARSLHAIGDIHYRLGEFSKALLFFNAAAGHPDAVDPDVSHYMRGWCHYMLGEDDRAADLFREFIKDFPGSNWAPYSAFWLAEQEYNRGDFAAAEASFMRFVSDYSRSGLADLALFWAGRAALMQKEFRRANDCFALLIKEYPASVKRAEARFYQGEALCDLGEFAGAILIFDEIIKLQPESYLAEMALFRKGDSQFTLGSEDKARYDEAIISYRTALDAPEVSSRSRWQAEYKIGRCLEKTGRAQEAFEYYMKVVYGYLEKWSRDPQSNVWFTRAAFNAAELQEQEKQWAKAVNLYQRVVDAGIPASRDAQERINRIRMDNWLFFY